MAAKKVRPVGRPSRIDEKIEGAREELRALIDTYDDLEFSGEHPVTFGDLRQIINRAARALELLRE